MKDYKKFLIAFVISQIITINNLLQIRFGNNSGVSLFNSLSIFLICIYYIYVFWGIFIRNDIIKYFSFKDSLYFYLDIGIKFLTAILVISYINTNIQIKNIYMVELALVVLDLFLGIKIVNVLKKINTNNIDNIKTYEFYAPSIMCNKKQYDEAFWGLGSGILICFINFDYSLIIMIPCVQTIATVIFIINYLVIGLLKNKLDKKLIYFNNLPKKIYKRSITYNFAVNFICYISCVLSKDLEIRFIVIGLWLISILVYSLVKFILPIVKTVNGMEKYLNNINTTSKNEGIIK